MAQQDDSVLGTEEPKGFLGSIMDTASDVVENLGSTASEVFDTAGDMAQGLYGAGKNIIKSVGDTVKESPIGDFFDGNDPVKLEESKYISKGMLEDVNAIEKDTIMDGVSDLWNGVSSLYKKYTNDDIQDMASFNAIQELRKNYNDEITPLIKERDNLKNSNNFSTTELERLNGLIKRVNEDYNKTETSLVNRAIRGNDDAQRRSKLEAINKTLQGDGKLSSEAEVVSKLSKETDDFIERISRNNSEYRGFEESHFMGSIQDLKGDLAEKLTSWKLNERKNIIAMRDAGISQDKIEDKIKEYDDMISLYEEMTEKTIANAYAGISGEEMAKNIAKSMGTEKINKMVEYDGRLTSNNQIDLGKSNFVNGNPFTGMIQFMGGAISNLGADVKDMFHGDSEEDSIKRFKDDTSEITLFDKSGIDKWTKWTLMNADDIGITAGEIALSSVISSVPFRVAGKLAGSSSYTSKAISRFNDVVKNNKVANFIINNKYVGLNNTIDNVVTGILPNAVINNAFNDVTSESRILFDTVMDIGMGPIMDTIISKGLQYTGIEKLASKAFSTLDETLSSTGIKGFKKTFEGVGGVPDEILIKDIAKTYGLSNEDSKELLDVVKVYREQTGINLPTERDAIDFTKKILSDLEQANGGVLNKDGVIARLNQDMQTYNRMDEGLSKNISDQLINGNIKLKDNTLNSLQVERLFKNIENSYTNTKEGFIQKTLMGLGIPKKEIINNYSEIIKPSNELYDLAIKAKKDIAEIKSRGELNLEKDGELLNNIARYQKLINQVASKFDKVKQYVDLYLANGEQIRMDITDIDTSGVRMKEKSGEKRALFESNSLYQQIERTEGVFNGLNYKTKKFLIHRGGKSGEFLSGEDIQDIMDGLLILTGTDAEIIKGDISNFKGLLGLYEVEDGKYKLYVGGKYLHNLDFNPSLKVEIELSGEEFIKATKDANKKAVETKPKIETKEDIITTEEYNKIKKKKFYNKEESDKIYKYEKSVNKTGDSKIVNGEVTSPTQKDVSTKKKVSLSREEVQQGEINNTIWNRILLSNRNFTADQFDDVIASEAINLKKLIVSKGGILNNSLTLKDAIEAKSYVFKRLRHHLQGMYTERGLDQLIGLLDRSVFSDGGLNLLAKFNRAIDGKIDKVNTLANLMESLSLHAAHRFKAFDLSENFIKRFDALKGDNRKINQTISDLLLGYDPVNALRLIKVPDGKKHFLDRLQDLTGIKINNYLLKNTDKELNDFLKTIVNNKVSRGEIKEVDIDHFQFNTANKLVDKVNKARDLYMGGIMKEIYKGNESVSAILDEIKERVLLKGKTITERELDEAKIFRDNILKANDYEEASNLLKQNDGITLTDGILKEVTEALNALNAKEIPNGDLILSNLITSISSVKGALLGTVENISKTGVGHKVFYADKFSLGDNIVTKSLNYILNPLSKAVIFEDGIAKEISRLIDTHLLDNKTGEGFYELSELIRKGELDESEILEVEAKTEALQTKLFEFLNNSELSKQYNGTKFSNKYLKELEKGFEKRNKKLEELFNGIKEHVSKQTKEDGSKLNYEVLGDKGEILSQEKVVELLFSKKSKLNSYNSILGTLQNRVKLSAFSGYKLDLKTNSFEVYTGLEEGKTLFRNLREKVSGDGLNFVPVIIEGGNDIWRFFKSTEGDKITRDNQIKINNFYNYLKNNPNAKDYKEIEKNLLSETKEHMKGLGYEKATIEQVALHLNLSKDINLLSLNIGDKDGLGIGFTADSNYYLKNNIKSYKDLQEKVANDFSTKFKGVYEFTEKDKNPKVIGKRISVLTHEDTTMTPGLELDTVDFVIEELGVIETLLKKHRAVVDGKEDIGVFDIPVTYNGKETTQDEVLSDIFERFNAYNNAKTPEEKIQIGEITIDEKKLVVDWYSSNEQISDSSIRYMPDEGNSEDLIKAKFDYLKTPVTDGASYQNRDLNRLMSLYQGYVTAEDPIKYHYSNLGKSLDKTLYSPYSDTLFKSLRDSFFSGTDKTFNGYEISASKIVGKESAKLGKYTKFSDSEIKYVIDETGVKRKIIGWKESNTKYNRPASEEVYIEGRDVNGITKQVAVQSHSVAKKLINNYELFRVKKLYDEVRQTLNLKGDLKVNLNTGYLDFVKQIGDKIELENIGETERKYVAGRFQDLLSYFEKPKEDGLGYRAAFIPRVTYKDINGKTKVTRNDELLLSEKRYNDLINGNGKDILPANTLKVGDDYYVTSYRSPVANSENCTLQKLVIDYSMKSQDVIGMSAFNVNVLKQADFDGDHLNIVYIKPGVHIGGIASALSFVLKSQNVGAGVIDDITRLIYNPSLSIQKNEEDALRIVNDFIKSHNGEELIMPSVVVSQVGAATKKEFKQRTYEELLSEGLTETWAGVAVPVIKFYGQTFEIVNRSSSRYKDILKNIKSKVEKATGDVSEEEYKLLQKYKTPKEMKKFIEDTYIEKAKKFGEGFSLIKANSDAIIGKDAISLVSATTRTFTILRDIAWEYQNRTITGMSDKLLARKLGLTEIDPVFLELKGLLSELNLSSKAYAGKSASVNQRTVDAAKTGELPPNWKKELEDVAFDGKKISEGISKYLEKVSINFSKTYNGEGFFNYFKHEGKKIEISDYFHPTIAGDNVELVDILKTVSSELDNDLSKGIKSIDKYMEVIEGVKPLNQYELLDMIKTMLPKELHWKADLLVTGKTTYALAKRKTKQNKKGIPVPITKQVNGKWVREYKDPEFLLKISQEDLLKEGFAIKKSKKLEYLQNEYFKNKEGRYAKAKPEFFNKETGQGLVVFIPKDKSFSIKDKLREEIINSLIGETGQASVKIKGTTKPIKEAYKKEDIIKILHLKTGSKYDKQYLEYLLSATFFPNEVINGKASMEGLAIAKVRTFLENQIGSAKVTEELQRKFGDILNAMGNFGKIKELKIGNNSLILKVDNIDIDDMKVELDGVFYDIKIKDDEVFITNVTGEDILGNNIKIVGTENIAKEFKYSPLTADFDLVDRLGVTSKSIKDAELLMDKYLKDIYSTASLTNSKIAGKYFRSDLIRNEDMAFAVKKGAYDEFSFIRRQYKGLDDGVRKEINNLIYYGRDGSIKKERFDKFSENPLAVDYIKRAQEFYDKYLRSAVDNKKINIPPKYFKGDILEDLIGLESGKSEKLAFLEKGVFDLESFDAYARKQMGDDYKTKDLPIVKGGKTTYGRKVTELYGGIFEINPLEGTWISGLRKIRNFSYEVIAGSLSWFTHLGGLLVGLAQIPVEFLRIQSLSSNIKGLSDNKKLDSLINKYGILHNVGIETAIRVGPQELNAPLIQRGLFNLLNNLGAIVGTNKEGFFVNFARKVAAFGSNPMLITDLVLDTSRKKGAIGDILFMLGFDSVDKFTSHLDSLSTKERDSLLSKIRLGAKNMYTDLSGGVNAGSYLYRETYMSRGKFLVTNTFLMGWGNRVWATAFEDASLFLKGAKAFALGDRAEGIDLMFRKSKFIEKNMINTIMTVAMFTKMQSHDDYDGEFNKRKSITDWILGMNSNFIAIQMSLPYKIIKAGYSGEEGIMTRIANVLNETMINTLRELDVVEIMFDNMEEWLKGDRESITDAVVEAISTKAAKGLLYNKVIVSDSLYSEFRSRDDSSNILALDMKAEDEKLYYDLYEKSNDLFLQALIDNNKHHLVLLEIIKSAPLIGLLAKDEDFGSYQTYIKQHKSLINYLSTDEYNKLFLDMDMGLGMINQGGNISKLYNGLETSVNSTEGLNPQGEAILKSNLANLNEDMLVNILKKKYGDQYYNIIAGASDGGLEYITEALVPDQLKTNQLLMKLASESPASSPYILGQLLKQELYEYEKDFKARRNIYGTEVPITTEELEAFQKVTLKKYEPLIRASALTENQYATFLAVSAKPELVNNVLNDTGFIKDAVADRVAMQLAVSKAFQRGETNPGYLATRMTTIGNKLERAYMGDADHEPTITELQFKEKMLDLYNYSLDQVNNATVSTDMKVEIKTALLKGLGTHGHILEEDPLLSEGFEGARVNLMHKLFDTIVDLKPYAEEAKIALAKSTGRITEGAGRMLSSYSGKKSGSGGLGGGLGSTIPKLRDMLNSPKNGFSKAYTPGKSGFNPSSLIRPLMLSKKNPMGPEEFREIMIAEGGTGLIKTPKEYQKQTQYIKIARSETIKQALEKMLPPIYVKPRTQGLLKGLPGNRD